MAKIQDYEFPEDLLYDLDNQVWYTPLPGGLVRAGFTPIAMTLAGEVLVFTPKRDGKDFEKGRWFATIECGKWIGSARAAFDGVVVSHNELLVRKPGLLNTDAFKSGWMLVVRPTPDDWQKNLVTGGAVSKAFDEWLAAEAYKDRTE